MAKPNNDSLRAEMNDRITLPTAEQASSSPAGNEPTQETYLVETEDGYAVRVPADRMESWQKAQEEHGSDPLTPFEQRLKERLLARVYGQKK